MKERLLWKLVFTNILPVIGATILVIWLAIDQLAANYFMALMKKYEVSPTDIHQMFLTAVHHYLIWASLAALLLSILLSFLLTRRVLRPLSQMTKITQDLSVGNFSARVEVASQDEVGQLGTAFNRMADSLEQVEKLRKTMVADVAHELRTPLTNLRGYFEAFTDEVLPPSKKTFQMLEQEIMRLVNLVESLQQLARADAARAHLNRDKFNLTESIKQIIDLYQPQFIEKNISVETHFSKVNTLIWADQDKLLQAMRNLLENSWKYTPQNGSVTIMSQDDPTSGIKVSFSNSGTEISADDLPFIFERFFRVDRSRSRDAGGAGIGLAIVKEMIEAHGGHVGAESNSTHTTVWFTLPA